MEAAYTIGGGGLNVKKYRMGTSDITRGVPVISDEATANTQGVLPCSTTAAVGCIGLAVDTVAASTAAQVAAGAGVLGNGDNASFVSVIINPDLVYRAKLNNGATEDTALAIITQASADTTGTAPGGGTPAVTDEATVWGYTGANAGQVRGPADAANSVLTAFPFDIAAGDQFLEAILNIDGASQTPTLTTLFTQIDATAAVATNANFNVVEFELRDEGEDGRNNSFALICAYDHAFAGSQLA